MRTGDASPGAPIDEFLQVYGIDEEGRVALQIWFDVEDFDAAIAELDALHARFEGEARSAQTPVIEFDTACVRMTEHVAAAFNRGDWHEFERLYAPEAFIESRRKIVGFTPNDIPFEDWQRENRRILETDDARFNHVVIAVRGERLALIRSVVGTADVSPGAPHDEFLQVGGIDREGRVELQIWFDLDDIDAAMAELDARYARLQEERSPVRRLENAASHAAERHSAHFAARDWDALAKVIAADIVVDDRRRVVNAGIKRGRDAEIANLRAVAEVGITYTAFVVIAARGERLILTRASVGGVGSAEFSTDALSVVEINSGNQIAAMVHLRRSNDFDAAIAELECPLSRRRSSTPCTDMVSDCQTRCVSIGRGELPPTTPDCVSVDHRRAAAFAPGELLPYLRAGFDLDQQVSPYYEIVLLLNDLGAVVTHAAHGTSREGFDAEWRASQHVNGRGEMISRCEIFDDNRDQPCDHEIPGELSLTGATPGICSKPSRRALRCTFAACD